MMMGMLAPGPEQRRSEQAERPKAHGSWRIDLDIGTCQRFDFVTVTHPRLAWLTSSIVFIAS